MCQDQVDVGILCSKCKALKINGCVVGSFEGRYHANSHVLANIGTTVKLCRINYFVKVTVKVSLHETPVEHLWFANVNCYIADEFKWWLGKPS